MPSFVLLSVECSDWLTNWFQNNTIRSIATHWEWVVQLAVVFQAPTEHKATTNRVLLAVVFQYLASKLIASLVKYHGTWYHCTSDALMDGMKLIEGLLPELDWNYDTTAFYHCGLSTVGNTTLLSLQATVSLDTHSNNTSWLNYLDTSELSDILEAGLCDWEMLHNQASISVDFMMKLVIWSALWGGMGESISCDKLLQGTWKFLNWKYIHTLSTCKSTVLALEERWHPECVSLLSVYKLIFLPRKYSSQF